MNNNKKLKSIMLSMVVVAGMLLPESGFAQERGGGLFGRGDVTESDGGFRGALNQGNPNIQSGNIQNDDFGAPIGSGIVILIGAGLGYVALKKKEDEQ